MGKFSNASRFMGSANAGLTPVNGMYVLYTRDKDTDISTVTSGGVLSDVVSSVNNTTVDAGICRIPATAGGNITFTSGGNYTFFANTGSYENVCGIPFSAGVYARATMLVHRDRGSNKDNGYMYDTGLNYDVLPTPTIAPANGVITIIEKVSL